MSAVILLGIAALVIGGAAAALRSILRRPRTTDLPACGGVIGPPPVKPPGVPPVPRI
jgi:hypothetical protein